MYTSLWGRHAWLFLHSITFQREGNNVIDTEKVIAFLDALGEFLPCPGCSAHYKDNQEEVVPNYKEAGKSFSNLEKFILGVHNAVNFTYNLPKVTLQQAKGLHKNVDWFKNWAYFMKAISILYKDPVPDEYHILAKMNTRVERIQFLETFKKKYPNDSSKIKIYHELRRHCIDNVYCELLEMTKEQKDKKIKELKEKKSDQLASVKEFLRMNITKDQHFEKQLGWHYQKKNTRKQMKDFLIGLSLLFPGKLERETYVKMINSPVCNIDNAINTNETLKFWLIRIINSIFKARGKNHFNISFANSKDEMIQYLKFKETHKMIKSSENTISMYQKQISKISNNNPILDKLNNKILKQRNEIKNFRTIINNLKIPQWVKNEIKNHEIRTSSGNHTEKEFYLFVYPEFQKIVISLENDKLGKDYGTTKHHEKYVGIVRQWASTHGRPTYPNHSDEYKKQRKAKIEKKLAKLSSKVSAQVSKSAAKFSMDMAEIAEQSIKSPHSTKQIIIK